jgi:hypothetical protein
MKVYIAAPWEEQPRGKLLAFALERAGLVVTSRWLEASRETLTDEWATNCLHDVAGADVLVAYNPETWARTGTGGRHVELGFALALGKLVLVVGARTNIFHHLAGVECLPISDDLVPQLTARIARAHEPRELSPAAAAAAVQRFVASRGTGA